MTNSKEILVSRVNDGVLYHFLILSTLLLLLNHTIKIVFNVENEVFRAALSLLFYGLSFLLFLFVFLKSLIKEGVVKRNVVLLLIFLVYFVINMIFHYERVRDYSFLLLWFLVMVFPYYSVASRVNNLERFFDLHKTYAKYFITLSVFMAVFSLKNRIVYDMTASYFICYSSMLGLMCCYNSRRPVLYFSVSFLLMLYVLVFGSRGAVLAFFSFFIFYFIIKYGFLRSLFILLSWLSILSISFFILNQLYGADFLYFIGDFFINSENQSRLLRIISSEEVDFSSGRNSIYEVSLGYIIENPLWGYGLAADRYLVPGTYAHNIYLEMLMQFGVPVATLFFLSILIVIAIFLFSEKSKCSKLVFGLYVCFGLVPLFYTGSYITSSSFAILVGLFFSSFKFHKYH